MVEGHRGADSRLFRWMCDAPPPLLLQFYCSAIMCSAMEMAVAVGCRAWVWCVMWVVVVKWNWVGHCQWGEAADCCRKSSQQLLRLMSGDKLTALA